VTRYLVDHSVLERLAQSAEVQSAVGALLEADHELCCTSLTLDGFAATARSAVAHAEGTRRLRTSFLYLPSSTDTDQIVLDIRSALWQAGKGRTPGVLEVAIAATAVTASAVVLHYDRDFDRIADVYPPLKSHWVVPRGSVR
jgi:predicted nucleic acid-binding protein